MIAYNKQWLDNLYLHSKLADAHKKNCIRTEELKACEEKYPVIFYTPNFFVRIGLFILTVVIAIFSFGLLSLMSGIASSGSFSGLLIFFALTTYGGLEFMVRTKHHYKSGVDDAMMWMTAIFVVAAFNLSGNISSLQNAFLVFVISFFFSLRFTNMVMSAVACVAFLAIIFFSYTRLGTNAKATASFLIMIVSALIYFFVAKNKQLESWKHYTDCLLMIEIVALLCLYVAGNYYVARETSISMFQLNLKENESIPFGWLFWIFTILIPLVYLARGIKKKDMVLIRIGLILIAAIIFTIRYYYHILPAEIAMMIGGIIMIAIAYTLIKYLKVPKYGFTDEEQSNANSFARKQIESLIIAETFGQTKIETHTGNSTEFGEGSGGGGGAGGEF